MIDVREKMKIVAQIWESAVCNNSYKEKLSGSVQVYHRLRDLKKITQCLIKNHAMKMCAQRSLNTALSRGTWSGLCPGRFIPGEIAPGTHWIGDWVILRNWSGRYGQKRDVSVWNQKPIFGCLSCELINALTEEQCLKNWLLASRI
jgi:hypothetical protein